MRFCHFLSTRRPAPPASRGDLAPPDVALPDGGPDAGAVDRSQRGVTLIEAMIVVAVLGILVTISVPGFSRVLSTHRAAAATNDFVHAIAVTRNEAIRRGSRVYMAPTGVLWRDGWAIFVDRNNDRHFDPPTSSGGDELITLHGPLPATVSMTNPANANLQSFTDVGKPPRTYLMFDGSGFPRQHNGAFSIGSLRVADQSGGVQTLRTICFASYGRVRVVPDKPTC